MARDAAAVEGGASKSREVRLGLVMFGGVSLAIYINGVAAELHRAVRGRGTYRLLKALTDSDIVVDILSGSSAGGVNGILLAYALCNQREFEPAAELWRKHGDAGGLLRDIHAPLAEYQSLFDSENKYEPWLFEAFEALERAPVRRDVPEDPSFSPELDLFVTGTDFYGRKWATVDDRGAVIEVKDHRTVFWLKHRAGRKEPFAPDAGEKDEPYGAHTATTHAALARLARVTSCFPGAFAPVTLTPGVAVDERLRRWGALVPGDGPRVLIDGGVLDNKPFSTTIDAIYSRLAERPVSRWLLYVEPDPERFEPDPPAPVAPDVVRTALASLVALPGYESIADDLRALRRHNQQTERFAWLREAVRKSPRGVMPEENQNYRRYRLLGFADDVLCPLFARELEADAARRPLEDRRTFEAEAALRSFFGIHVVEPGADLFARFAAVDVLFFMRRLYYLTYAHEAELMARPALLSEVNRRIESLEVLRAAFAAAVEEVASEAFAGAGREPALPLDEAWARAVWTRTATRLTELASVEGPGSSGGLRGFSLRLKQLDTSPGLSFFEHEEREERALLADAPVLRDAYDGFQHVDAELYPLEVVSGLRSQDTVRVARVSPLDAQRGLSKVSIRHKVTGIHLGHFAAFFKRSWRSNDILWGRLDSACELTELLLDQPRIEALFASDDARLTAGTRAVALARLREAIDSIERDTATLPLAPADRALLFVWLRRLASAELAERRAAVDEFARAGGRPGDTATPLELLVRGAQLEILPRGLVAVFEDAEVERRDAKEPEDSVLNTTRALLHAEQTVEKLAQSERGLAGYFGSEYGVGKETLANVPPLELLDRVTRAAIVAQNSLVASTGPHARNLRAHPLYRILVAYPLLALAALVDLLKRAPAAVATFTVGSLFYVALSLVVLWLWDPLAESGTHRLVGGVLFVGLPAALVVVLWFLVRLRRGPGGATRVGRFVGALLALAFVAATLPLLAGILRADAYAPCVELVGAPQAAWCAPWSEPAVSALRFAVLASAVLGMLWMFGALAWVGRELRALGSKTAVSSRRP